MGENAIQQYVHGVTGRIGSAEGFPEKGKPRGISPAANARHERKKVDNEGYQEAKSCGNNGFSCTHGFQGFDSRITDDLK